MPFYQIMPAAYLYPDKVKAASDRKQLEEPVRQWCAYELIRTYGIAVINIEFERPVRMGSRPHWIDILVSREGKPSVVVECKKPSDRNADKALEQAVSYADAPEIQAEFAVVTNGKDWQVKRRILGKWCAVPDLSREVDQHTALAEYGMRQGRQDELYPKSAPSLHRTLRDYLDYALIFHLNVSLPDHLDDIWIGDMRGYCRATWEQAEVDGSGGFSEFVGMWASLLVSKVQFWKRGPLR